MKRIDAAAVIFFTIIIGLKMWLYFSKPNAIGIPNNLYLLHVVGIFLILVSLAAVRYKYRILMTFIPLAFLLSIIENVWTLQIGDIKTPYFLIRIAGYLFFFFFLWMWAKTSLKKGANKG
jgi:hypothetical protein